MEMKAEYRTIFSEEAREHLEEWESALLRLEQNQGDKELIHQIFRAIHTLKGSAGFIGFEKLQKLTHDLESALQDVRDGATELTTEIVEVLFQGLDLSRRMVESFTGGEEFGEDIDAFLGTLWAQNESTGSEKSEESSEEHQSGPAEESEVAQSLPEEQPVTDSAYVGEAGEADGTHRRFQLELFIQSSGREAFLRSFLVRNRLSGVATILSEDPAPEILKDSGGRFTYKMILETNADEEILRETLNIDLLEITSLQELKGEALRSGTKEPVVKEEDGSTTSSETVARAAKADEVVRVSVERLDTLLNLVGELVIQNSGFISIAQELKNSYGKSTRVMELGEKTETLAKITRDLQDGIMKVRMLPVTNVFSRFHRVVRDLAKDRKKEITLDVFGEETEIDKKVMDRIGNPLIHLIRNAVDHGIEFREERLAAGKAPVGLVRLGAYQDGDHICIEVSDDGKGLNKEAVLRKAIEKALVREEEAGKLSDEQVLSLIFLPGFSTVNEVSEVSGRGVGMDVVKRAIEGMGGNIRIRSFVGKGTTVTISLPLTMAIIPAVLVEVSGSTLAVPLSSVKEVLKIGDSELKSVGTRPAIRLRDEVLAVVHLREALSLESNGSHEEAEDPRTPVVIVDYEEKKIGLGVDKVIGTGEIVIKSLSRHYREIEGLIGASILGNGRIALILDVEALVRQYYHGERNERTFTDSNIFNFQASIRRSDEISAVPGRSTGANKTDESSEVPEVSEVLAGEGVPESGEEAEGAQESPSPEELAQEISRGKGALLEEIHNAGAIQASMAVSQLTGQEIRVSFPESQIVALGNVATNLCGEEVPVGGIYIGLAGELSGGMLIVLPEEHLLKFHELLYRLPQGACTSLEEIDLSAISELGNILSASFICAMSDETKLGIKNETPEVIMDMCLAVIDSVLARFNQSGERILLTKALLFGSESEEVVCHLLMFLEPESLQRLMDVLGSDLE